jgi:hypothetical protein
MIRGFKDSCHFARTLVHFAGLPMDAASLVMQGFISARRLTAKESAQAAAVLREELTWRDIGRRGKFILSEAHQKGLL